MVDLGGAVRAFTGGPATLDDPCRIESRLGALRNGRASPIPRGSIRAPFRPRSGRIPPFGIPDPAASRNMIDCFEQPATSQPHQCPKGLQMGPATAAMEMNATPPIIPAGRDLRLDLFRGLALWLIFLDHIPSNMVSWITIRNYGFSDATEIFVFISGYTAAFVYGREMRDRGVVVASARILKRAWQVYVAHIFLFVIYMAEISYVAASFDNPLYGEEMGIFNFLKQPDVTLIQAMLLKFKPANMDVLPLYIVLLTGLPPMLWLLLRWPATALGASMLLYVLT